MTAMRATAQTILRKYLDLPAAVHLLCFGAFINRVGSFVMLFLTIYVTEQLGASERFATWCVSVFGFGCMLSNLIGGQFADQFGRRRTLLLGLFGGSAALVLLSIVKAPIAFMIVLFCFALVMEMYRPATAAFLGDVTTPEQRPHAYGLMFMAINLGFSFAPPIGGALSERSFSSLFLTDAVTTALYGVVVFLFVRESIPRRDERAEQIPFREAVRHIASDTTFVQFTLCHLISLVVFMQGFTTLPLYLRDLGFSKQDFGLMICINGVLIVLLQMPMTHWLSRFDRAKIMVAGELLLAVGFGLTGFGTSAAWIVGSIAFWTLGEIFQSPYKQAIVAEMARPELRGRYMGIFNLAFATALMIAPVAGGELLTRFGPHVLWPSCFLTLMVTTAMYVRLGSRLSAKSCEAPTTDTDTASPVAAGKSASSSIPSATEFDLPHAVPELKPCESLSS